MGREVNDVWLGFEGVREYALRNSAKFVCLKELSGLTNAAGLGLDGLICITAECNFSGVKMPLDAVARLKAETNLKVLLDAAKYASTSPLDLR